MGCPAKKQKRGELSVALTREHAAKEACTAPAAETLALFLNRASKSLNLFLARLACGCLLAMVLLTVANAVLRAYRTPFAGTTEVVGWLTALTTAFGLGYTQVTRGYVEIDSLVRRLPAPLQKGTRCAVLLACAVFGALVSFKLGAYALTVCRNGNLSETLQLPFYPLIFLLALGFAALALALLADFLKECLEGRARPS